MKKLTVILSFTAIAMLGILSSCKFSCIKGNGNQSAETRKPGNFSSIEIEGGYKVHLKQDSSMSITIHADENLLKYIKTTIDGGKLRISSKKSLCPQGEMSIDIGAGKFDELKLAGAIELTGAGKFNLQDLKMAASGANRVTLDVNAANVETDASGSNEFHLTGQASSHKITMNGSGKLYALDFVVGNYRLETAGASHSEINVLHELSIKSAGASEVKYKGNPSVIHNDKAGASTVEKVQ